MRALFLQAAGAGVWPPLRLVQSNQGSPHPLLICCPPGPSPSDRQQQLTGTAPQRAGHHLNVACVSTQVSASRLLNVPRLLTSLLVRTGFATRCVEPFVGWCGRAGVLVCGLLVVGSVVVCVGAAERASEGTWVFGEWRGETLPRAGRVHCSAHCSSGGESWRLRFSERVGNDPNRRTTSTARRCAPL